MDERSDGRTGDTDRAALQIRLLGAPQILLDGAPLSGLTSAKAQGLLFYLAVTGRMHTRSASAALLWGDFPQASARGNLRKALQHLRRHLGAFLAIDRDTVALAPDADVWVDVTEFEAALQEREVAEAWEPVRRALDLYRGDFLDGFYVRRAPDFEDWWLSERARLREMMLEALHALAVHQADRKDLEGAVALAHRLLELEPWREEVHRRLMTWLALDGQRGAALAQYEVCRQVLADELGVEPAEETTALYERIRDGDVRPPAVSMPRPVDVEPQRPAFLDRDAVGPVQPKEHFVARQSQLSRLAEFLEAALAGRGQVAFVSGEAGWGKTRLLDEFSRRAQEAHSDLIVASGVCTTFTGAGDPYLPFREILRTLCADVDQGWAAGAITREHALRLWWFLPRVVEALVTQSRHLLGTIVPAEPLLPRAAAHPSVEPEHVRRLQDLIDRGSSHADDASVDQGRIFEEVADLIHGLSRHQSLLLTLDDLHWADASSIGLLFHLGRRLAGSRVLVLGTYRPEDVALGRDGGQHPLVGLINEFRRLFGDLSVTLGRHEGDGRAFVDALLDSEANRLDEEFRAQLARSTGGHPLFAVEILRGLKERGYVYRDEQGRWAARPTVAWSPLPDRVEGVIEKRINRLEAELREPLEVASVEGEAFTAEVVAQIVGVDEASLVRLLSGDLSRKHHLVRAGGVRQVDGTRLSRYRFGHNLFQRHLYQSLDPAERAYLHENVGKALETLYRGQTEEVAAQLARHFREAGRLGSAVDYRRDAGDAAARVYANAEAVGHFRQAMDIAQAIDLDGQELTELALRLGRALELDSRFDEALRAYQRLEELAERRDDRRMELASLMARATVQAMPSAIHDPERARKLGERALVLADSLGDRAAEARILWILSYAAFYAGRHADGIDHGERSLELARELGLREQTAQTLNDLGGLSYLYSGRILQAIPVLEEASELWEELGNKPMLADSLAAASTAHVVAGMFDQGKALSDRAFEISQSIGNLWGQSYSRWKVGLAYWEQGDLNRAIQVMEESVRLAELVDLAPPQTGTQGELAALYGELGAVARGLEAASAALSAAEKHDYFLDGASIVAILARLHALNGDIDEARARIEEAREDPRRDLWPFTLVTALVAEAEMALHLQDHGHCLSVTDTLLAHLRHYNMRLFLPRALWLRGKALLGLGREEDARDTLSEARAEAEALGSRRMLWRILSALSQLEEDQAEADALRRRAREIIRTIVAHIDQMELRTSFLRLPEVRAVLSPDGSVSRSTSG